MSESPITSVLNLLRLIKSAGIPNNSPVDHLRLWADSDVTDAVLLRLTAYISDQCKACSDIISQSSMTDEAKAGLLQTVSGLSTAFSLAGIHTALTNYLPQIDTSISQFAILASVTGTDVRNSAPVEADIASLIADIEAVRLSVSDAGFDPALKALAERHLHVLQMLLRNVDVMGLDAALAAYTELVIRLRRAESKASPTARERLAAVWPKIEQWTGRLAIIEKAINSGSSVLGDLSGAAHHLLQYVPHAL